MRQARNSLVISYGNKPKQSLLLKISDTKSSEVKRNDLLFKLYAFLY